MSEILRRLIPASRFGAHLDDKACPAAGGFVRNDLDGSAIARIPQVHDDWHFTREVYDGLAGWWNWGGAEPLLITGPAGCGKTSSVLEFCGRLGMPVVSFTARPRMDRRELVGRWVLAEGGMRWVDGPAALAWRHGWLLLVNEFSAAPPEAWVSANDLLEGLPLENDQTGEMIPRHPLARIVFTDNTRGHSTEIEAGYFGRQMQDRSVIDRLWHLRYSGLSENEECGVLLASLDPGLAGRAGPHAEEICRLVARVSAGSRYRAGQQSIGFENRSFALSIRSARRMAGLLVRFAAGELGDVADPIAFAADMAVGNALDGSVRDALLTYLKTEMGDRISRIALELRRSAKGSGASARRRTRSAASTVSADPAGAA